MNERIQELVLESNNPYGNFDYEKFAELIVNECIDTLAWHGENEAVSKLEWFKVNKLGVK